MVNFQTNENSNTSFSPFSFVLFTAITMTLGLPQLPKEWGNDRVLGFVRFMWSHWKSTKTVEPLKDIDKEKDLSRGPAPPSMVAASAKRAFGSLSKSEESRIAFQNELQNQIGDNPIVAPDTTILVRSRSGQNLQIPRWGEEQINEIVLDPETNNVQQDKLWNSSETDSFERSSCTGSSFLSFQNAPAFEAKFKISSESEVTITSKFNSNFLNFFTAKDINGIPLKV